MKAWLRTFLMSLLVGGLVYLVSEERYRRRQNTIRLQVDENTPELIAQMRADIAREMGSNRISETFDTLINTVNHMGATIKQMVEEDKQSLQLNRDTADELAVALGQPDLAQDPLSAEFRLAIERKKSE